MNKQDAIKYLTQKINADKKFAIKMLAELIFKNCEQAQLEKAIKEWNAKKEIHEPSKPKLESDWDEI